VITTIMRDILVLGGKYIPHGREQGCLAGVVMLGLGGLIINFRIALDRMLFLVPISAWMWGRIPPRDVSQ
jgi:hypothetical protein